jgi:hypothetical protein
LILKESLHVIISAIEERKQQARMNFKYQQQHHTGHQMPQSFQTNKPTTIPTNSAPTLYRDANQYWTKFQQQCRCQPTIWRTILRQHQFNAKAPTTPEIGKKKKV